MHRYSPDSFSLVLPLITFSLLTALQPQPAIAENSKLWGQQGELWKPDGPLPDFSFAGYQRGEKPIPNRTADVSVSDFGAKGDGTTDDTKAFQDAIEQSGGKVIAIPEGRYVIKGILTIKKSGTVLQGAGSGKTLFICPTPLEEIYPKPITHPKTKTAYCWSGGVIKVFGFSFGYEKLAGINEGPKRGAREIEVDDASSLEVGQNIILHLTDDSENSLLTYIYSGEPGSLSSITKPSVYRQICRVEKIDGNKLSLDRPLRYDLKSDWTPELRKYDPRLEEVGIEGIGFVFPEQDYEGHFTEVGYNAISLQQVANCWIRDIHIKNSDNGIFLAATHFCTMSGIVIESERKPDSQQDCTGHHGISVTGADNLVTDFSINTKFIHDITVEKSVGNVFSKGKGIDLSLDHHRLGPYENLFTKLDAGIGSRLFMSGGSKDRGKHCGAGATFWNIESKEQQSWPVDFGPERMNWIGLNTREKESLNSDGIWLEKMAPDNLTPKNLHQAQLQRRVAPNASPAIEQSNSNSTFHHWKKTAGKVIQARFIAIEGESVILIIKNGKKVKYPLNMFAPESRELADKLEKQ